MTSASQWEAAAGHNIDKPSIAIRYASLLLIYFIILYFLLPYYGHYCYNPDNLRAEEAVLLLEMIMVHHGHHREVNL